MHFIKTWKIAILLQVKKNQMAYHLLFSCCNTLLSLSSHICRSLAFSNQQILSVVDQSDGNDEALHSLVTQQLLSSQSNSFITIKQQNYQTNLYQLLTKVCLSKNNFYIICICSGLFWQCLELPLYNYILIYLSILSKTSTQSIENLRTLIHA